MPADHNEDDVFAVLPLPPRVRRSFALPPKHPSPPRPSLQGPLPDDKMKIRSVSFKNRDIDSKDGMPASGMRVIQKLNILQLSKGVQTGQSCGHVGSFPQSCLSMQSSQATCNVRRRAAT